jgi:hypothetical protein
MRKGRWKRRNPVRSLRGDMSREYRCSGVLEARGESDEQAKGERKAEMIWRSKECGAKRATEMVSDSENRLRRC